MRHRLLGSCACPVFALLLALLLASSVAAQGRFDNVEIQTTKVAEGVWMLIGTGGNIGVSAGADGVFLIDDQYAPLTDKIKAAVSGIADGAAIRFVLNTHWHGDHTGGNENLGGEGVLIVAHDNVRARMSTDQFIEALEAAVEPSPKVALPVVTFADAVTFHLNGDTIHAHHTGPAHTDGDSIVRFEKANVVHMGDIYFNGMYPFIDVSSGGSVNGVIEAVSHVVDEIDTDTKVIPGHGPLSNRAELTVYRDMLKDVRDAVAALIAKGHSRAEILEAKPSAAYDEKWGGGFRNPDAFVGSVYDTLTRNLM